MKQPIPAVELFHPEWNLLQTTVREYQIEDLFSLSVIQKRTRTKIIMDLINQQITTEKIPALSEVLKENLPSILSSICYNDLELPFYEEVQHTEIGHLFEHILLEYLCKNKIAKGAKRATYQGRTSWNWVRDPLGRFHIHLTCGKKDEDILLSSLEQSVQLMKLILQYQKRPFPSLRARHSALNGLKNGERRW